MTNFRVDEDTEAKINVDYDKIIDYCISKSKSYGILIAQRPTIWHFIRSLSWLRKGNKYVLMLYCKVPLGDIKCKKKELPDIDINVFGKIKMK